MTTILDKKSDSYVILFCFSNQVMSGLVCKAWFIKGQNIF